MSKTESNNSGGAKFLDLLTILFIALKLMGYIDWPWWVVLAPLWVTFLIIIVIAIIVACAEQ